ncbi:IS3 family transposase [Pseudomonas sp. Hg5Tf]|uniref:IS3 family transposase n=1 Tax=Pseudomonas sp. Hg7Tf TaxID=3236988 RepID=A0AB39I2A5_9PSED
MQLKASFAASGGCYGSRPLRKELRAKGMEVGVYKTRRLMRANGLRSAWKRKFVHTTNSKHDLPVAENVLNRQFEPEAVNTGARCLHRLVTPRERLCLQGHSRLCQQLAQQLAAKTLQTSVLYTFERLSVVNHKSCGQALTLRSQA